MSQIVAPVPVAPQLYAAYQVRLIDPAQNGVIHMVDGSARVYGVTTGSPAITFVPQAGSNVVPGISDWILEPRPVLGTASATGPGTETVAKRFQVPMANPAGPGPFIVLTNAQYIAAYNSNYSAGTPSQGVVP
jgi:hypothetical protein